MVELLLLAVLSVWTRVPMVCPLFSLLILFHAPHYLHLVIFSLSMNWLEQDDITPPALLSSGPSHLSPSIRLLMTSLIYANDQDLRLTPAPPEIPTRVSPLFLLLSFPIPIIVLTGSLVHPKQIRRRRRRPTCYRRCSTQRI